MLNNYSKNSNNNNNANVGNVNGSELRRNVVRSRGWKEGAREREKESVREREEKQKKKVFPEN